MTEGSVLDVLEELITTVVEPAAADVDANERSHFRRPHSATPACSAC